MLTKPKIRKVLGERRLASKSRAEEQHIALQREKLGLNWDQDSNTAAMGGAKLLKIVESKVTVWRVKLNMNTTNYHYYEYDKTPLLHPFQS